MSVQWNESYATNVVDIDTQHRRLFDMLNDLERRLTRGDTPKQMVPVLDGLAQYVAEHFAFEEGLMEQTRCPLAWVNKMAHQRFTRMVGEALERSRSEGVTRDLFESLHLEIETWVKDHICRIDRKLRDSIPCA